MDVLTDEQALHSVLDPDLGGIDNDALEFDLEKFINDDNVCLPDDPIPAVAFSYPHHNNGSGFRINNIHLRGHQNGHGLEQNPIPQVTQGTQGPGLHQPPASMYTCNQQQQMTNGMPYHELNPMIHTTLPDSPPDSEPYSPPDGHPSTSTCNHPDTSKYNLTSTPSSMHSHMYPSHHRPPGPPPKTIVTMPGYHEPPPLLNPHLPPVTIPTPASMPNPPLSINQQILSPGNLSPTMGTSQKKRKRIDSPNSTLNSAIFNGRNGMIPTIKQEPSAAGSSYTNYMVDDDDCMYNTDSGSGFVDGTYQVIKWQPFQVNKWATLTDCNLKDLPAPQYRVDADKGFNFSATDDSFVCQKKNHFQVTCHVCMSGDPKYVRTSEGVKKIDNYCLHFNGVKMESQSQSIKVEQSQSDRSKKPFLPVKLDLLPDQVTKMTVGRLHFSETTANNMRKKGRPNPDQRYFMLVVSLHAHSGENNYMIASSVSERIIVRASNPGQFDNDVDTLWQKGHNQDSVVYMGKVGVNTDHPDEAMTVHGNMKLTGHLLQPSDIRAKEDIAEVDSKDQLKNVSQMRIYNYKFKDNFADHVGLPKNQRKDTGVIAQEVLEVLPEAVRETQDIDLPGGEKIENLLVVNKDRIFMENVGAVKELCKLTDNLEVRIDELEKMNKKLSKLKRFDSLKSTVSSKSSGSTASSVPKKPPSYTPHVINTRDKKAPTPPTRQRANNGWCSNRFIQITVIILICIMAFCLIAITILYILERQKEQPHVTVNNFHGHGVTNASQHHPTPPTMTTKSTHFPSPVVHLSTTSPPILTSISWPVTPVSAAVVPPTCQQSQCEPLCCGAQHDEPEGGEDLEGYSIFREDVNRRRAEAEKTTTVPNPGYTVLPPSGSEPGSQPGPESGSGSGEGSGDVGTGQGLSTPTIEVILNRNRPSVSKIKQRMGNDILSGLYKRRRRETSSPTSNIEFAAEITLVKGNLNFTVTDRNKDLQMSVGNNITYNFPYSQLMTYEPVQLKFTVAEGHMVHKCHQYLGNSCQTTMSDEILPDGEFAWKIPYGLYEKSFFRFRVTRSNNTEPEVCLQPGDESPGMFTEYNLFFSRRCTSLED